MGTAQGGHHPASRRGDVDHAAVSLGLHGGERGPREEKGGHHVDLERGAELRRIEVAEARRLRVRGIVHDDVEAAEPRQQLRYQRFGHAVGGHVAGRRERALTKCGRHRRGARRVAGVDRHGGAEFVESLRRGPPEASRRSGDERDASVQIDDGGRRVHRAMVSPGTGPRERSGSCGGLRGGWRGASCAMGPPSTVQPLECAGALASTTGRVRSSTGLRH